MSVSKSRQSREYSFCTEATRGPPAPSAAPFQAAGPPGGVVGQPEVEHVARLHEACERARHVGHVLAHLGRVLAVGS